MPIRVGVIDESVAVIRSVPSMLTITCVEVNRIRTTFDVPVLNDSL